MAIGGWSMTVRELGVAERETLFDEIMDLYLAVGWSNYTVRPDMLRTAYARSLSVWGAFEEGRLVGIVRAVGDGVSIVFVQDIIVCPELQRRGIGTTLMRAVGERFSRVYQMELLTEDAPGTRGFYESLGLVRADALGCVTYVRQRT